MSHPSVITFLDDEKFVCACLILPLMLVSNQCPLDYNDYNA